MPSPAKSPAPVLLAAGLAACALALAASAPALAQQGGTPPGDGGASAPAGDPDAGARLYKRYCRGCHGEDGRGGAHTFMPHVGNLTRKGYIDVLPDSYLYTVIAKGGEATGKNAYMPAWENTLSGQQIRDVIAHIRTMPAH